MMAARIIVGTVFLVLLALLVWARYAWRDSAMEELGRGLVFLALELLAALNLLGLVVLLLVRVKK